MLVLAIRKEVSEALRTCAASLAWPRTIYQYRLAGKTLIFWCFSLGKGTCTRPNLESVHSARSTETSIINNIIRSLTSIIINNQKMYNNNYNIINIIVVYIQNITLNLHYTH